MAQNKYVATELQLNVFYILVRVQHNRLSVLGKLCRNFNRS